MSRPSGSIPLSRRELWDIVRRLVADRGLTVLLSTAYLDEAERCSRVIMLHRGPRALAGLAAAGGRQGGRAQFRRHPGRGPVGAQPAGTAARPAGHRRCGARRRARALRSRRQPARTGRTEVPRRRRSARSARQPVAPRFEDGFMILLQEHSARERSKHHRRSPTRSRAARRRAVVRVQQLVKKFGAFTAVDRIELRGAPRRDLRAARAQRRRQDHHISHAVRSARAERRRAAGGGRRTCATLRPRRAPGSVTWRRSSPSTAR